MTITNEHIDITLDVSVGVLTTLKGVAKISTVPFLSNAASIALSIIYVVQKMRGNKRRFKELAKDSCEVVCNIIDAQKDVSQPEDVPIDLATHLEQLVNVLLSIMAFAQKGASRNVFAAMLRYNADARRIERYQKKLYQSIHIFGLQSHIIVRKTVVQLAANQVAMTNQLNSITAHILTLPPSVLPQLPVVPDILRGAPNDTSKLVNFRMLSGLENILSMDNVSVSSEPAPEEGQLPSAGLLPGLARWSRRALNGILNELVDTGQREDEVRSAQITDRQHVRSLVSVEFVHLQTGLPVSVVHLVALERLS